MLPFKAKVIIAATIVLAVIATQVLPNKLQIRVQAIEGPVHPGTHSIEELNEMSFDELVQYMGFRGNQKGYEKYNLALIIATTKAGTKEEYHRWIESGGRNCRKGENPARARAVECFGRPPRTVSFLVIRGI